MDANISTQNSCMLSWCGILQLGSFSSVTLSVMALFWSWKFFFDVIYRSCLLVMFFLFQYFKPKLFCFLHPVVSMFSSSLYLCISIFECPVLFLLFGLVLVTIKSPFFCQYLLIYLIKFYCQTCPLFCLGLFSSTYFSIFFPFRVFLLVVEVSLTVFLP